MNPNDDMPAALRELPEEAVRYVLGEMSLDEQLRFELRLCDDDGLAAAVTKAMALDELLHQAMEQQVAAPHARQRPAFAWLMLAATAILAVGAWWILSREDSLACEVAIAGSAPSFQQFVADLGIAADRAPAEALRADASPLPRGSERVEELMRRVRERVDRSLADGSVEVVGTAFVVPIATDREIWTVVMASLPDGSRQLYFPNADAIAGEPSARGRLTGGRHVLPTESIRSSAEQRALGVVAFTPGFVLPLRADRAVVCTAVCTNPLTRTQWQQLRRLADEFGNSEETKMRLQQVLPAAHIFELRVRAP